MKLVETNVSSVCESNEETLIHLFYECEKVKPFLQIILHKIWELDPTIQITSSDILLGFCKKSFKLDILFLEIKRYIYYCKTKLTTPSKYGLRNRLRLASNIYNST